ncbi:MAG: tRNA dihydrouridine(20/20a) synthase DusA [Holosporales bacterium]|jgi:tRNA-dihydrouridine synthase A
MKWRVCLLFDTTLAVAPMLDVTHRHCRFLHRLLSPHAVLYTEMITSAALVHGNRERLLAFSPEEQPVVLQLGGSDPAQMAEAARHAAAAGYREININVGCPSDRVQAGRFGACLMREPDIVAACAKAMQQASGLAITVKTRLGVDNDDSEDFLRRFIDTVANAGVGHFILHARKAYLKGLSPKENRTKPPIQYERVYRLKAEYPALRVTLNGEINTIDAAQQHLRHVDAVMIGREAWHNPYFLTELDHALYGTPLPDRAIIAEQYRAYTLDYPNDSPSLLVQPLHGLYHGQPGARAWRRSLGQL